MTVKQLMDFLSTVDNKNIDVSIHGAEYEIEIVDARDCESIYGSEYVSLYPGSD